MCRSAAEGGRRCPGLGCDDRTAARKNGNRRRARAARKAITEHLATHGEPDLAALLTTAPSPALPAVMTHLGMPAGETDEPVPNAATSELLDRIDQIRATRKPLARAAAALAKANDRFAAAKAEYEDARTIDLKLAAENPWAASEEDLEEKDAARRRLNAASKELAAAEAAVLKAETIHTWRASAALSPADRDAYLHSLTAEQRRFIAGKDTELHAQIEAAAQRHQARAAKAYATRVAAAARDDVLAAGGTPEEARKAYQQAYRHPGTRTHGGGYIPDFGHPDGLTSLDNDQYTAAHHCGLGLSGTATTSDYRVIATRSRDDAAPLQWGFRKTAFDRVITTPMKQLARGHKTYLAAELDADERATLTDYTGRDYRDINGVLTGRDASPTPKALAGAEHIRSIAARIAAKPPAADPLTLMRGTTVPENWPGDRAHYMRTAFPVGSRVQLAQATSTTTDWETTMAFVGWKDDGRGYLLAIRTRSGLVIKSLSEAPDEDEALLPPGTDYRCVHLDHDGIGGLPTVYLVEESLVAEADQQL